jgi:hypothetical protein
VGTRAIGAHPSLYNLSRQLVFHNLRHHLGFGGAAFPQFNVKIGRAPPTNGLLAVFRFFVTPDRMPAWKSLGLDDTQRTVSARIAAYGARCVAGESSSARICFKRKVRRRLFSVGAETIVVSMYG